LAVEATELCPRIAIPLPLRAAFGERAFAHCHSLGMILLFLQLLLDGILGFRRAAAAVRICGGLFPTDVRAPSPNGGQMWLLRVGLYEILRPKELAEDWIWLIDHTIQTGCLKVLVVVGIRRSVWDSLRCQPDSTGALKQRDLSVWLLDAVETSDGPKVARQLTELSARTGVVPQAVLSDCGADLNNGIERYRATHPQVLALKDLPHFAANAVKRELKDDPQWTAFLTASNRAKNQLRQTKFAFLLPPDLKAKARWMNLDPLLNWSGKVLEFLQQPRPIPGIIWEDAELQAKMGWIEVFRPSLAAWTLMLTVVATCLTYIRKHGYHRQACAELTTQLAPLRTSDDTPAERVAERILAYVQAQSADVPEGQRLLASTEVLESLIGKAKQLEGRQSRSGFTKSILGLAASVVELNTEVIDQALHAVKVKTVHDWVRRMFGISIQAQRQHAFPQPKNGTKPADRKHRP